MSNLYVLTKRELWAFFLAPFSYMVMAFYLILVGVFFYVDFTGSWMLNQGFLFQQIAFFSVFFVPLLTMRLFAEEKARGTIETLMTAPVSDAEVVVSKFLAAFGFYTVMLAPTLIYFLLVRIAGKPDLWPAVTQYVGVLLVGGLYIAVGFFASTLTRNQVLAAVLAIVVLILMWFLGVVAQIATDGDQLSTWFKVGRYMSPLAHFDGFMKGILDSSDVVFFLSFIVYFLFLSVRSVETRKWS
jgi:ABC-2 type transport system permease protein